MTKREQLLAFLSEAEALLRRYGEKYWAAWLHRDADLMRSGDGYGLEHLLRAFGGMGSFNDLMLHRLNGHQIRDDETHFVNDRLEQLRSEIYSVADELRRLQA